MTNQVLRKPIKGWEGYYEVDTEGNVYSLDRVITVADHGRVYRKPIKGHKTKGNKTSHGYLSVTLHKDGINEMAYVHRLVAEAFIPNPNNYGVINHIDENKQNNRVENLEWCTQYYNLNYRGARERQAAKTRGLKRTPEQKARQKEALVEYYKTHKSNTYGKPSKKRIPVLCRQVGESEWIEYPSLTHAANAVGVTSADVSRVCLKKIRQTHGYEFKYARETRDGD